MAAFVADIVVAALLFVRCSLGFQSVKDLEIIVEDKPEICDEFAAIGDTVFVDYTGMLKNGRIFDTSLQEGRSPLKFQLGDGSLIRGWEKGIQGMCIGEKRKLIIPPYLAYGNKGVEGVIPPDSTLLFQVHLINLERPSFVNQFYIFVQIAVWPVSILIILYYLYRKVSTSMTKEERKADRKSWRKRK